MENKSEHGEKDIMKDMCVGQGYVPATCLLPGPIILFTTREGGDACKGCHHDRNICHGRPRAEDTKVET